MGVVKDINISSLSKFIHCWHNLRAAIKMTCAHCGSEMVYLGESCNPENGTDLEYKCSCMNLIQIIHK